MPALNLTYSSLAAEPKPIFIGRPQLSTTASVPSTVSARLKFDGTWGSSKYYDTGGAVFIDRDDSTCAEQDCDYLV